MLFSSFFHSQGSAEALVMWGGKVKYLLIADFLINTCSKNCQNRFTYVRVMGDKVVTFFGTQCRFICDSHRLEHSSLLLKRLNTLKIPEIKKLRTSVFMFKLNHNLFPPIISSYFYLVVTFTVIIPNLVKIIICTQLVLILGNVIQGIFTIHISTVRFSCT